MQLCGAGSFTPDFPDRSVDQHLIDWINHTKGRFHWYIMGQATAFLGIILLTWIQIFGPTDLVNRSDLHPFGHQYTDPRRASYKDKALIPPTGTKPQAIIIAATP